MTGGWLCEHCWLTAQCVCAHRRIWRANSWLMKTPLPLLLAVLVVLLHQMMQPTSKQHGGVMLWM